MAYNIYLKAHGLGVRFGLDDFTMEQLNAFYEIKRFTDEQELKNVKSGANNC